MSQRIHLDATPGLFHQVLHCHQGDVGRQFEIAVVTRDGYEIPSGATFKIQATKPSGLGFTVTGTAANNIISFTSTEDMTSEAGEIPTQLEIKSGNDVIYTSNFLLVCEKNTHPASITDGSPEEIISEITLLVERAESAASTAGADAAAAAQARVDEMMDYLPSEVADLKSGLGDIIDSNELIHAIDLKALDIVHGYIARSNKIFYTDSSYSAVLIPWTFGEEQKIKFIVNSGQIRVSFLNSNELTHTSLAPLCNSYKGSQLITAEMEMFPPYECKYIYVLYEDVEATPKVADFEAYAFNRSAFNYDYSISGYEWMAFGVYTTKLAEANFANAGGLLSTIISLNGIKAFVPHFQATDSFKPNWRLFDEDKNEILKESGAYFYGVETDKLYMLPNNAKYMQMGYNYVYMSNFSVNFFTGDYNTYNLKSTGGIFDTNGLPATPITDSNTYKKNLITRNYLSIPQDVFINVRKDSTQTATIYCYDSQREYLRNAINGIVPNKTKYIKILLSSATDFASDKDITIDVFYTGETPKVAKNGIPRSPLDFVSYDVKMPNPSISADRLWNNGYILLPPNYTADGEPVKLALYVHGTEGYVFDETDIAIYRTYMDFVANNGYAIIDCSSLTSHYKKTVHDCNFATELSVECIKNLYNYIIEAYNVESDGLYVFGKSAGGLNSIMISGMSNIPIKCMGLLAPALDAITTARVMAFAYDLNVWAEQLNFDGQFEGGYLSSVADKEVVLDNVDKLVGYNPIWLHTISMDFKDFATYVLQSTFSTAGYEGNTDLVGLINGAYALCNTPLRIWHAVDDTNVPIATSRFLQKMLKKAGGQCILTEYPAGQGAHNAMDRGEDAPKVQYETKYAGTVTISKGYAELVDWMNLF